MLASKGVEREEGIMKPVPIVYTFVLIFVTFSISAGGQNVTKQSSADFGKRVREYTSQREAIESRLPKLPKQATAEQIAAHKKALLEGVLARRRAAVRGTVFTPEAERMVRSIVTSHYTGRDRMELRKELAEAENKTVAVKVNAVYPESAELLEMPPTLLLALPPLPKQVRYRFVGTNLLIVDRENHLIVDYMTNALP